MKSFDYVITDPVGIHARPAGILVKEIKKFAGSTVTITKGEKTVKAIQLMKLMGLGIKTGETVTIGAEGPDEDAAIEAIRAFFEENL